MASPSSSMSPVSQSQIRRIELQRRSKFLQPAFLGSMFDELFTLVYLALIATVVLYLFLNRSA